LVTAAKLGLEGPKDLKEEAGAEKEGKKEKEKEEKELKKAQQEKEKKEKEAKMAQLQAQKVNYRRRPIGFIVWVLCGLATNGIYRRKRRTQCTNTTTCSRASSFRRSPPASRPRPMRSVPLWWAYLPTRTSPSWEPRYCDDQSQFFFFFFFLLLFTF
jgi:hypothetical protein